MEAIQKEVDKVQKQSQQFHQQNVPSAIDKLISNQVQVKQFTQEMQSLMKDYYGALGKLQKGVDKVFAGSIDLDAAYRKELFSRPQLIDQAVSLHFVREGQFAIAEGMQLRDEALMIEMQKLKTQFSVLYEIVGAIMNGDLSLALRWSEQHSEQLEKRSSPLEFDCRKMQFLLILGGYLKNGQQGYEGQMQVVEALSYARSDLARFGEARILQIKKLVGATIFQLAEHQNVKNPYSGLLLPVRLKDIPVKVEVLQRLDKLKQQFTREFCALIGMSQDSPLISALDVGINSVPIMVKLRNVIDDSVQSSKRKRTADQMMWTMMADTLPIELPLPKNMRHHSVFACPVSREQTSEINPPMMLPCGHVLSLDSLVRVSQKGRTGIIPTATPTSTANSAVQAPASSSATLQQQQSPVSASTLLGGLSASEIGKMLEQRKLDVFHGVNTAAKLKCPYCPQDTTVGQAMRVRF